MCVFKLPALCVCSAPIRAFFFLQINFLSFSREAIFFSTMARHVSLQYTQIDCQRVSKEIQRHDRRSLPFFRNRLANYKQLSQFSSHRFLKLQPLQSCIDSFMPLPKWHLILSIISDEKFVRDSARLQTFSKLTRLYLAFLLPISRHTITPQLKNHGRCK